MFLLVIIILLAFFLQASSIFVIFNTPCNFLLIATVLAGLRLIPYKAGFFGFFSGLLVDILEMGHFGINTLSLTIIAILVSVFSKRIYPKIYVLFSLVFLGTMVSEIISLLFKACTINFLSILKEGLYNSSLSTLIFLFVKKRL